MDCFKQKKNTTTAVIVVGNLSVGGNGKTPLILHLLDTFKRKGYHPGVVSRGYGGVHPQLINGESLVVDINQQAQQYGDEPWMIAKKTLCPVVVGRKRSHAVAYLVNEFNCDVVLSDDGLQHYGMHRDIEICVVDQSKRFGNGFCLPAGPLREPQSRLKEIDFIVNHYHSGEHKVIDGISMYLEFDKVYSLASDKNTIAIDEFKNKTVHAIAGIASPMRFFKQLQQYGIKLIEHEFADHYQYQRSDFNFDDSLAILMTEKDAVKCLNFNLSNSYVVCVKSILSEDLAQSIINKLNH